MAEEEEAPEGEVSDEPKGRFPTLKEIGISDKLGIKIKKKKSFGISKIQIRQGKSQKLYGIDLQNPYFLDVPPEVSEESTEYKPMPYTFRVGSSGRRVHNICARTPPFYLILDHTIAIIWLLFSANEYKAPLGLVQLQWALSFLQTIYLKNGSHAKDVQVCIDALQDLLLDRYAALSDEMEKIDEIEKNIVYDQGYFAKPSVVQCEIPFSWNYADMIQNCSENLLQDQEGALVNEDEILAELDNIKKTAGIVELKDLSGEYKDKAVGYLNIWKDGQVGKIKTELKRLRSIESLIRTCDEDNFAGHIEDHDMSTFKTK